MSQLITLVAACVGRGEYRHIRRLMHVLDELMHACEAKCREIERPSRRRAYEAVEFIARARVAEAELFCGACGGKPTRWVLGVAAVCPTCEGAAVTIERT